MTKTSSKPYSLRSVADRLGRLVGRLAEEPADLVPEVVDELARAGIWICHIAPYVFSSFLDFLRAVANEIANLNLHGLRC